VNGATVNAALDLAGALLLLGGAFFCFAGAVGVLRFPDVLTRLHAATKPQVFGRVLVRAGVAVTLRTWQSAVLCVLIVALQVLTTPVSGHMLARTAYRTGQWNDGAAVVDALARDLADAGFVQADGPEPPTGEDEGPASMVRP